MKLLKPFFIFLSLFVITSCSLDDPFVMYTNVAIPIDSRNIPETGVVNSPLPIYAHAEAPDGCWSGIHFVFDTISDYYFQMVALANYENRGSCPDIIATADTIISITPDKAGEYVIKTWINGYYYEYDTITIVEPGK